MTQMNSVPDFVVTPCDRRDYPAKVPKQNKTECMNECKDVLKRLSVREAMRERWLEKILEHRSSNEHYERWEPMGPKSASRSHTVRIARCVNGLCRTHKRNIMNAFGQSTS